MCTSKNAVFSCGYSLSSPAGSLDRCLPDLQQGYKQHGLSALRGATKNSPRCCALGAWKFQELPAQLPPE